MQHTDEMETRRWCYEQASAALGNNQARFAIAYAQELYDWVAKGDMTEAAKRCLNSRKDVDLLDRVAVAQRVEREREDARFRRTNGLPEDFDVSGR